MFLMKTIIIELNRTPKYVTHLGPPRFFVGLIQKIRTKAPVQILSQLFARAFVRGSFVWKVLSGVVFVRTPFCQNTSMLRQKVKNHFNFMFHMYDKKFISVTSHALDPLLLPISDPLPSSVTYFMDGLYRPIIRLYMLCLTHKLISSSK